MKPSSFLVTSAIAGVLIAGFSADSDSPALFTVLADETQDYNLLVASQAGDFAAAQKLFPQEQTSMLPQPKDGRHSCLPALRAT